VARRIRRWLVVVAVVATVVWLVWLAAWWLFAENANL
jgi:hypothetical protein